MQGSTVDATRAAVHQAIRKRFKGYAYRGILVSSMTSEDQRSEPEKKRKPRTIYDRKVVEQVIDEDLEAGVLVIDQLFYFPYLRHIDDVIEETERRAG